MQLHNEPEGIEPTEDPVGAERTLFPGDTGALDSSARRILVQLLSGPSLEAERHPNLWPVLLNQEAAIRSRLSELFLELVLDRETGVAFTRQALVDPTQHLPRLLRTVSLTLLDSILLLHLRQLMAQAQVRGERCVVSRAQLEQYLAPFERSSSKDSAGFAKRMNSSIDKMIKHSVLHKLRGEDDRYEVSSTLRLLFPAEDVSALSERYKQLLEGGVSDGAEAGVEQDEAGGAE